MYDRYIETLDREELKKLQSERLVKKLQQVYANVKPYREKMSIKPEDIKSVDDLYKLPFTTKQDLRDNYPYGMFAVPMSEVVRIHATSGTTGKQTVVGYTKNDLEIWSECVARTLVANGADENDVVHIAYGYGLFTGGLGMHYGVEKIGATVVPASTGDTAKQITMMQDFGATILCCTPSYALYIADELKGSKLNLKVGIFGAEPWSENMRKQLDEKFNIKSYDIFGIAEIIGPGVAYECEYRNGFHVNEDHFLIEIIDFEGNPVPNGTEGEVVFTCITKEALPLIRYNTHDISSITHESCPCGRTFVRMNKLKGRSDDMLIIRGVNVFPSQVESVLLSIGNVDPHYLIIVDRVNNLDVVEVQVEISEQVFSDSIKGLEELNNKIKNAVKSVIGLSAKISLVGPGAIERTSGKAKHVIDKRRL